MIRTQPTRSSLSTLESVAHALAWLEKNPDIVEVSPWTELCVAEEPLSCLLMLHFSHDNS